MAPGAATTGMWYGADGGSNYEVDDYDNLELIESELNRVQLQGEGGFDPNLYVRTIANEAPHQVE